MAAAMPNDRIMCGISFFPVAIYPGIRIAIKENDAGFAELIRNSQGINEMRKPHLPALFAAEDRNILKALRRGKLD